MFTVHKITRELGTIVEVNPFIHVFSTIEKAKAAIEKDKAEVFEGDDEAPELEWSKDEYGMPMAIVCDFDDGDSYHIVKVDLD